MIVLPQRKAAIGEVIEWLLLIWGATDADEWRDRIEYLPYR